jgi:hypothetical protein
MSKSGLIKIIPTKECGKFCKTTYVDLFKKKRIKHNLTSKQKKSIKKIIGPLCKLTYCNEGCISMIGPRKIKNNVCTGKKCKNTYTKAKKHPIQSYCEYDDVWD